MQFSLPNSQTFPAFFQTKGSFPIMFPFIANKHPLFESFAKPQLNKDWYENLEGNSCFDSSDHQQLGSPRLSSVSTTPSSENTERSFSHLCSLSKKISKDFQGKDQKNHKKPKKRIKRDLWKPEEDKILLELIDVHGLKWTRIGKAIGGRTGKQVRDRYLNYLKPGVNSQDYWSVEEDRRFLSLYSIFRNRWSLIAKFMPGRSECQVKNRFHSQSIKEKISNEQSHHKIIQNRLTTINEKCLRKLNSIIEEKRNLKACQAYEQSVLRGQEKPTFEGFEIFLNKFTEGSEEEASEPEETFYDPNQQIYPSDVAQEFPLFSLDFGEEHNLQSLL